MAAHRHLHDPWQPLPPSRLQPVRTQAWNAPPLAKAPTEKKGVARKPLPLPKDSLNEDEETLLDPKVVDAAAYLNAYLRPDKQPRRTTRKPSPSVSSRCSTILDYYLGDPTPLNSPELPPAPLQGPPQIDAALVEFDFGLSNQSTQRTPTGSPDAKAGAERSPPRVTILTTNSPMRPRLPSGSRTQYSLFPAVKDAPKSTPPLVRAVTETPPSGRRYYPVRTTQPTPTHKPRKESISTSFRNRRDSLTAARTTGPIPLRLLSSPPSTLTGSPREDRRWSDETITSPTTATRSKGRVSFSSILRKDSMQYPDCFFEDDDDEGVPLRRKLGWSRSTMSRDDAATSTSPGRRRRRGLLNLLCCCGAD